MLVGKMIVDQIDGKVFTRLASAERHTHGCSKGKSPKFQVPQQIVIEITIVDYKEVLLKFSTLDSEDGLSEDEEFKDAVDFEDRKNALVLRTQLSVRVHAIIDKLLQSQGRELRRALFNLKEILQSDKDLVHEFVANKGLDCLMQVGNMADHNYLDYILRALGQVLLYVDGMHGVMSSSRCIQWLYSLISNKFRHIVKTALKLLVVFVDYTEKNSLLLIDAINTVDGQNTNQPWCSVMNILQDFDKSDTELLIYATTLINRCLNNLPDRDAYYDQVDALQAQGMDGIIKYYMSKQGTDLDLLWQLQIFQAVLLYEDGDKTGTALKQIDESTLNCIIRRRMSNTKEANSISRNQTNDKVLTTANLIIPQEHKEQPTLRQSPPTPPNCDRKKNLEHITALRRRRFARQKEMLASNITLNSTTDATSNANGNTKKGNQKYTSGLKQRIESGTLGHVTAVDALTVIIQKQADSPTETKGIILNKEHSIKDLAQKLTSSPVTHTEEKPLRVCEMIGIVSKAKQELAKSQSKEVIRTPILEKSQKVNDIKVPENDLNWEEIRRRGLSRQFYLCDLDFSDLRAVSDDDDDDTLPSATNSCNGPPLPPLFPCPSMPPPLPAGSFSTFPKTYVPPPPKIPQEVSNGSDSSTITKKKKTVKLFWNEIQENPALPLINPKASGFIWDDLPDVKLDTAKLEHLFESRTKDLIVKEKLMEPKRHLILDTKRSNAINIAMKKLPTPQTIKAAIMKMDATVIGREGIEKLLTMLPTEEEKVKIQEAQNANPDLPLGSAEQFLLTLASINELSSRLKLWVFKLDFDYLEREVAEPLMDLKQGIELLKANRTFKVILATLRSVGSFLNGNQVKGFRLEYLSKVTEVKDTVHKHPLLYHICEMIKEKFPDTTDFFSEVGPVIRASKVDFDNLEANLLKLESDCKASWDHMKRVAKHDGSQMFKAKISEFLTDAAERIALLTVIKERVMARYSKFLIYLGVPLQDIPKTKPSVFLTVIADFALEYRTTRERVIQQLERRVNHRERNKTRGKLITDLGNYSNKNGDPNADCALKALLNAEPYTNSLYKTRSKEAPTINNGFVSADLSADEEIIESLVRSVTFKGKPVVQRERRKNRISDKKLWNRPLNGRDERISHQN